MPCQIMKRGVERWRASVQVAGKKKQKLCRTRREAIAWEEETRKRLQKGSEQKTDTACFSVFDWLNKVLDDSKKHNVAQTYDEKYRTFARFLAYVEPASTEEDFVPSVFINEITGDMASNFLELQKKSRSAHSANVDRKNLIAAWNLGVKKRWAGFQVNVNPFSEVRKFGHIPETRYTPSEVDFWKVVNLAERQDKVMLLAFFDLAARRGELFRLKWEDVDFNNGTVLLKTRKRRDGQLEGDRLPLTKRLRQSLLWWFHNREHKESEYVFTVTGEYLFENQFEGEPYKERRHYMARACKRAGVTPFGFHGIRHLVATLMFHRGETIAAIQRVLRHKTPSTTQTYLRSLGLDDTKDVLKRHEELSAGTVVFPCVFGKAEGY